MRRIPGECERKYLLRVGALVDEHYFPSWDYVTPYINSEWREDESFHRTASAYRKKYAEGRDWWEEVFSDMLSIDEQGDTTEAAKHLRELERALRVERYKLQAEKIENNKWLREYARNDLLREQIIEAITDLPPLPAPRKLDVSSNERGYFLCFGDEHFGIEFEIFGLHGEILNAYNPEIFQRRMEDLLAQTIAIVEKEGITTLNVYCMGDFIEGILRFSDLMKLRYGVVNGTVLYGRYLAHWLNELSYHVRIVFQMAVGNHSELRLLDGKKGTFKHENMAVVVQEIVTTRLADNPNFECIQNPTGLIFDEVCGLNVLGIHGEVKDLAAAIQDFSNTYRTEIHILIGGHLHHSANEEVGVCKDVIRVSSIIGINDFSMTINKTANPGATLFVVERGKGKTQEYNIKL